MTVRTLKGLDLTNKTVLVRADLNVPIKDGQIIDATRIERFIPTLQMLIHNKAKIVIFTHLRRPKTSNDSQFSLLPVVKALRSLLGKSDLPLKTLEEAPETLKSLSAGDVMMIENIRFYREETSNDLNFAKQLAALGDIYLNDAFSVSHRAHASVEAITRCLPSYAGPQLIHEVEALSQAFATPERPLMAIVAGAKVSTKLTLLEKLSQKVETLVIAGGLAHTFLDAQGFRVGKDSLSEQEMIPLTHKILQFSKAEIILPVDVRVASQVTLNESFDTVPIDSIPMDKIIVDMGDQTYEIIKQKLSNSKTIIWNGAVGIVEICPFDQGTIKIARVIASLTQGGNLFSFAGGGETIAGLNKAGVIDRLSYVSSAGGAFLEYLEGKTLPGVAALLN